MFGQGRNSSNVSQSAKRTAADKLRGTHGIGPRLSGRGRVLGDANDRATHVDAVKGLDGVLGVAVREVLDDTVSVKSAQQPLTKQDHERPHNSPFRRVAPRNLRVVHIASGSGKILQVLLCGVAHVCNADQKWVAAGKGTKGEERGQGQLVVRFLQCMGCPRLQHSDRRMSGSGEDRRPYPRSERMAAGSRATWPVHGATEKQEPTRSGACQRASADTEE